MANVVEWVEPVESALDGAGDGAGLVSGLLSSPRSKSKGKFPATDTKGESNPDIHSSATCVELPEGNRPESLPVGDC